jgi:elongator complex protein 3
MLSLPNSVYILKELSLGSKITDKKYRQLLARYPFEGSRLYSKSELLEKYRSLVAQGIIQRDIKLENFLKTKPTRTISGVVPVTVLTKPYPCPGKCIFCPTEADQPKSYLSSEPGAARAKMFHFDPYKQVQIRIQALRNIGHPTDKIELIILGGTWSFYTKKYQEWFILRCFQALNDHLEFINRQSYYNNRSLEELKNDLVQEHKKNEKAEHRCVGLVIETRPDFITKKEVMWLRFLGVTKVQIGVQSLQKKILQANQREHTVEDVKKAFKLLRLAGFKIHAHWMFNLYLSSPRRDIDDFKKLFSDKSFCPDELKLYPCLLLPKTKLYQLYKCGLYKPYTKDELLQVLIKCKKIVPRYCRINRLFRDIPAFEVVGGVKESNFREIVKEEMKKQNIFCQCIRCREIRNEPFDQSKLHFHDTIYETSSSTEHFLEYGTQNNKLVGFLRLTLPNRTYSKRNFIEELKQCALIREVHVYGESLNLKAKIENDKNESVSQHRGIGSLLLEKAEKITRKHLYKKIAVIAAIGTREYYRKRRYNLGKLYMFKEIS